MCDIFFIRSSLGTGVLALMLYTVPAKASQSNSPDSGCEWQGGVETERHICFVAGAIVVLQTVNSLIAGYSLVMLSLTIPQGTANQGWAVFCDDCTLVD